MIYIDEPREYDAKFGPSCHLFSDDHSPAGVEELHRVARLMRLNRAWFQDRRGFPHYDVFGRSLEARIAHAVSLGVKQVTPREMALITREARNHA